jgi:hypothetical protein
MHLRLVTFTTAGLFLIRYSHKLRQKRSLGFAVFMRNLCPYAHSDATGLITEWMMDLLDSITAVSAAAVVIAALLYRL